MASNSVGNSRMVLVLFSNLIQQVSIKIIQTEFYGFVCRMGGLTVILVVAVVVAKPAVVRVLWLAGRIVLLSLLAVLVDLLCLGGRGVPDVEHVGFALLRKVVIFRTPPILLRQRERVDGQLVHAFDSLLEGTEVVGTHHLVVDYFFPSAVRCGEVKNHVPLVLLDVEAGVAYVFVQLGICEIVRGEREPFRRLNHWLGLAIEVDRGVVEVSSPELVAGHVDRAVRTVSEEN